MAGDDEPELKPGPGWIPHFGQMTITREGLLYIVSISMPHGSTMILGKGLTMVEAIDDARHFLAKWIAVLSEWRAKSMLAGDL